MAAAAPADAEAEMKEETTGGAQLSLASVHHCLVDGCIARGGGCFPDAREIAERLMGGDGEGAGTEAVRAVMRELQEIHGAVLHPHAPHEAWIVHPFSAQPTGCTVHAPGGKEWFSPCIWCASGAAGIVGEESVVVATSFAGSHRPVCLTVEGNEIRDAYFPTVFADGEAPRRGGSSEADADTPDIDAMVVHFPVPMKNAWDNVVFTCSLMLLFENATSVDAWCARHNVERGDVRPLRQAFAFAQEWYGGHRDPNWKKWTLQQAVEMFERHGLSGPIWDLGATSEGERF